MFEAFSDNADDPQATGVANLSASFEKVLRTARRDHMPLQRYDIPYGDDPVRFVRRFWARSTLRFSMRRAAPPGCCTMQARATAEQLQRALTSRIIIEQAKGMIAAREGISVDEAFDRLRRHSRRHGAIIHDVARAVVELELAV